MGERARGPAAGLPLPLSAGLQHHLRHLPAHVLRIPAGRLEGDPQAHSEPGAALRVRHASARARFQVGEFRPGGRRIRYRADRFSSPGSADCARPEQLRAAHRLRLLPHHLDRDPRRLRGLLQPHQPLRARRTAGLQPAVHHSGGRADSGQRRPALHRRDLPPSGRRARGLCGCHPREPLHRGAQSAGRAPAHALRAAVQLRHPAADVPRFRAGRGLCRATAR